MHYLNYISVLLTTLVFSTYGCQNFKKHKAKVTIINTWEMPNELEEISGMSWIAAGKIAAIEDEDGIIYIYDLKESKVSKTIKFAGDGDYEGIAVNGNDAYVMRSDGLLFKVENYQAANPEVVTYQTAMSHKNNIESLALDASHNRLIFAPKDKDPNDKNTKGLYGFDLQKQRMIPDLIFKIDMKDQALKDFRKKKERNTFRPSDVAINPQTGEIYVLEGVHPKLMILDASGAIKTVFELDKDDFAQPEGITFSPDGRLFISNEGHGGTATIVELKINK